MSTTVSKLNKLSQTPPTVQFGGGYSNDRDMAGNYLCITGGNITYSGNKEIIFDFTKNPTFQQVSSSIIASGGVDINVGVFSLDSNAIYVHNINNTQFSQSQSYMTELTLPTKIRNPTSFGPEVLNSYGSAVYKEGGPDEFRTYCGDSYVQQEHMGTLLAATFKLEFASEKDLTIFGQNLNIKVAKIFSFSESVQKVSSQYKVDGTLSFEAIQIGGDVTKLSSIFSSAGKNIVTCDLEKATDCDAVVQAVINYAAHDFPNQVNVTSGGSFQGTPAVMNITTPSYASLGLPNIGPTIITSNISVARDVLYNTYLNMSSYQKLFEHELAYNSGANNKTHIQQQLDNANYNLGVLLDQNPDYKGAIECYFTPQNCVDIQEEIVGALKPIETSYVEV